MFFRSSASSKAKEQELLDRISSIELQLNTVSAESQRQTLKLQELQENMEKASKGGILQRLASPFAPGKAVQSETGSGISVKRVQSETGSASSSTSSSSSSSDDSDRGSLYRTKDGKLIRITRRGDNVKIEPVR